MTTAHGRRAGVGVRAAKPCAARAGFGQIDGGIGLKDHRADVQIVRLGNRCSCGDSDRATPGVEAKSSRDGGRIFIGRVDGESICSEHVERACTGLHVAPAIKGDVTGILVKVVQVQQAARVHGDVLPDLVVVQIPHQRGRPAAALTDHQTRRDGLKTVNLVQRQRAGIDECIAGVRIIGPATQRQRTRSHFGQSPRPADDSGKQQ